MNVHDGLIVDLHREAMKQVPGQQLAQGEPAGVHWSELAPAAPDSPLCLEWNTYRREVGRLLAEGHANRHVLIKEEQILGIWSTHDEAMEAGYREFLGQAFLVHQIQEREQALRCITVRQWPNLSSPSRLAS